MKQGGPGPSTSPGLRPCTPRGRLRPRRGSGAQGPRASQARRGRGPGVRESQGLRREQGDGGRAGPQPQRRAVGPVRCRAPQAAAARRLQRRARRPHEVWAPDHPTEPADFPGLAAEGAAGRRPGARGRVQGCREPRGAAGQPAGTFPGGGGDEDKGLLCVCPSVP